MPKLKTDFSTFTNAELAEWLIDREDVVFTEQLAGDDSELGRFLLELDKRFSAGTEKKRYEQNYEAEIEHIRWLNRRHG